MVILTSIERETVGFFFLRKSPDLPLGDTATVALVDGDMLTRVWNEMDYRIDVCRITKGGHVEHL